jgi:capsid protein
MSKPKRSKVYTVRMTITPPDGGTALTVSGPCSSPEFGRMLWLLAAYMGGLVPAVDLTKEVDDLRLAMERGVPADHRAGDGRLPADVERMASDRPRDLLVPPTTKATT